MTYLNYGRFPKRYTVSDLWQHEEWKVHVYSREDKVTIPLHDGVMVRMSTRSPPPAPRGSVLLVHRGQDESLVPRLYMHAAACLSLSLSLFLSQRGGGGGLAGMVCWYISTVAAGTALRACWGRAWVGGGTLNPKP